MKQHSKQSMRTCFFICQLPVDTVSEAAAAGYIYRRYGLSAHAKMYCEKEERRQPEQLRLIL